MIISIKVAEQSFAGFWHIVHPLDVIFDDGRLSWSGNIKDFICFDFNNAN